MKELKNCRKCGRLFSTDYESDYCISCEIEEELLFRLLKEYLYDNPGTNITKLSEIFQVDIHRIYRYVKEGRLKGAFSNCNNFQDLP